MANLKQAGAKRLAQLSKRPDLPPWWQPLSYVLLILFPVYLGVSVLRAPTVETGLAGSRPVAQQPASGPILAPTPPQGVVPSPTDVPVTVAPGEDGDEEADERSPSVAPGDVVVATIQGGSAPVPLAAYETARAAARALFSGDFSQLPLAASAQLPTGLPRYPEPALGTTILEESAGSRMVFSTLVDPDGPGPERSRPVTVTVVLESGSWRFGAYGF
jgi:hypothetical protein